MEWTHRGPQNNKRTTSHQHSQQRTMNNASSADTCTLVRRLRELYTSLYRGVTGGASPHARRLPSINPAPCVHVARGSESIMFSKISNNYKFLPYELYYSRTTAVSYITDATVERSERVIAGCYVGNRSFFWWAIPLQQTISMLLYENRVYCCIFCVIYSSINKNMHTVIFTCAYLYYIILLYKFKYEHSIFYTKNRAGVCFTPIPTTRDLTIFIYTCI